MDAYRQTCALANDLRTESYSGDRAATRAYNAMSTAALHMREMLGIHKDSDRD